MTATSANPSTTIGHGGEQLPTTPTSVWVSLSKQLQYRCSIAFVQQNGHKYLPTRLTCNFFYFTAALNLSPCVLQPAIVTARAPSVTMTQSCTEPPVMAAIAGTVPKILMAQTVSAAWTTTTESRVAAAACPAAAILLVSSLPNAWPLPAFSKTHLMAICW